MDADIINTLRPYLPILLVALILAIIIFFIHFRKESNNAFWKDLIKSIPGSLISSAVFAMLLILFTYLFSPPPGDSSSGLSSPTPVPTQYSQPQTVQEPQILETPDSTPAFAPMPTAIQTDPPPTRQPVIPDTPAPAPETSQPAVEPPQVITPPPTVEPVQTPEATPEPVPTAAPTKPPYLPDVLP